MSLLSSNPGRGRGSCKSASGELTPPHSQGATRGATRLRRPEPYTINHKPELVNLQSTNPQQGLSVWRGKLIRKHPPDARGVISVSEDQLINATFQLQPGFRDGRGRESGNNASGELMSTVHSQPQNPLLQPQEE